MPPAAVRGESVSPELWRRGVSARFLKRELSKVLVAQLLESVLGGVAVR